MSLRIKLKVWPVGPTSGWVARNSAMGTRSSGCFTHSLSMPKTDPGLPADPLAISVSTGPGTSSFTLMLWLP